MKKLSPLLGLAAAVVIVTPSLLSDTPGAMSYDSVRIGVNKETLSVRFYFQAQGKEFQTQGIDCSDMQGTTHTEMLRFNQASAADPAAPRILRKAVEDIIPLWGIAAMQCRNVQGQAIALAYN